jgi:predicted porin
MINTMNKPRLAALGLAAVAVCGYGQTAFAADPTFLQQVQSSTSGFYGVADVSLDAATKGINPNSAYTYGPATSLNQTYFPKTGGPGPGPVGRVGWLPDLSSNKSIVGWRGDHPITDTDLAAIVQLEASYSVTAAPGLKASNNQTSNLVGGAIGSGDTFVGMTSKDWGTLKAGTMYTPYKKSTDRMNPFSGELGDYAVIMGHTSGDNRVHFGFRLDHSLAYESPQKDGFSVDGLWSPGQNRTYDNVVQAEGSSDCTGFNVPGSGNLPLNCDDGGFADAYSVALKYETKHFYATAAWELHHNVNRNSDGVGSTNPIYGYLVNTHSPLLDWNTYNNIAAQFPAGYYAGVGGSPPFLGDIADESAAKIGAQYLFDSGTTVSAIFERLRRNDPPQFQFINDRQRNGTWLAVSQNIGAKQNVSAGWGHGFKTPGDPGGIHNYDPNNPNDQVDMYTLAWKYKLDAHVTLYIDAAQTLNSGNAHYDLGAGGRGVTIDCYDGSNTVQNDYSSNGPVSWGGCHLKGVSAGMNYQF